MAYATDAQKSFIKKLLKEKFQVNGKLEDNYSYFRVVNKSDSDPLDKKIRITTKGYLDGNEITKLQASGIIATLLDPEGYLTEDGRWVNFGMENQTWFELIKR